MIKKHTGPVSSARILGLSQKHFASPEAMQGALHALTEEELRDCRGGLRIIQA